MPEGPGLFLSPQVIVPATHFSPAVLRAMMASCAHVRSDWFQVIFPGFFALLLSKTAAISNTDVIQM